MFEKFNEMFAAAVTWVKDKFVALTQTSPIVLAAVVVVLATALTLVFVKDAVAADKKVGEFKDESGVISLYASGCKNDGVMGTVPDKYKPDVKHGVAVPVPATGLPRMEFCWISFDGVVFLVNPGQLMPLAPAEAFGL